MYFAIFVPATKNCVVVGADAVNLNDILSKHSEKERALSKVTLPLYEVTVHVAAIS